MNSQLVEEKLKELPEKLQEEALDFIEFLISKSRKDNRGETFNFNWEAGLSNYKDKYQK